jgi:hypothetical protein
LSACGGEYGGTNPAAAYRRFVEAGLSTPPPSPFREAFGGWVLGSAGFVAGLRERVGPVRGNPPAPEARQLAGLDPADVCAAVAKYYALDPEDLARRHDSHVARAVAAWLCRRYSEAPLRELAKHFGLSRADSVPNLTRRAEARLRTSPELAHDIDRIIRRIEGKTKNKF